MGCDRQPEEMSNLQNIDWPLLGIRIYIVSLFLILKVIGFFIWQEIARLQNSMPTRA
jgi:hypothetical protein